jgi:hypothetical protein
MSRFIISDESIAEVGRVIAARQAEEKEETISYWQREAKDYLERLFNHIKYNPTLDPQLKRLVEAYEEAQTEIKDLQN